jgi:hypothetical protein
MDSVPSSPRLKWFWGFVLVCLSGQTLLAVDAARTWTPTLDEFWHLPLGLQMWKQGRTDLNPINPPPIRLWAALPLWLRGIEPGVVPPNADPLSIGNAFLIEQGPRHRQLYWSGRLMIIPLGLAAGALLAGLARRWFGDRAGMLAAVMWTGCPTWLAQSAVVTHDLAAAAGVVASIAALERFHRDRTWGCAVLFGIALGVAQLAKFTCVLLIPLCGLLWFVLPRADGVARSAPRTLQQVAVAVLVAWMMLQVGYGLPSASLLPPAYLRGWVMLQNDLNNPHPVFLNGDWREGGFPQYYAWAFADKLPLGTLGCLLIAIWICRRGTDAATNRCRLACLLAFLAFFGPASLSRNQLGIRYVLPAYPWLILFASQAATLIDIQRRTWMTVGVLLLAASIPLSLRYHPHHLAYFNELAGGPTGAVQRLVDSNVDWGQDLHSLAEYLRSHDIDNVGLAYFGTVAPSTVGIRYHFPPPRNPVPGRYALSVNLVAGRPATLRDIDGRLYQAGLDDFGYFRYFEPDARIGYSINVYDLSPEDVARFYSARASAMGP